MIWREESAVYTMVYEWAHFSFIPILFEIFFIITQMAQHLTTQQRHTIIVLDEEGYSQRAIANTVGCS
jgi:hypothetical protein